MMRDFNVGWGFHNLPQPVIEWAAGVGIGQSRPPAQHRTGGADGVARGDDVVHEIQGQQVNRAGPADKMMRLGFGATPMRSPWE